MDTMYHSAVFFYLRKAYIIKIKKTEAANAYCIGCFTLKRYNIIKYPDNAFQFFYKSDFHQMLNSSLAYNGRQI